MAQRKQLSWSELRVGLFVLVGLLVVAVGIFYVTGAGMWGAKYELKTYLPEAADLQVGASVRLNGVEVGNVDSVKINPHPTTSNDDIEVGMRINKAYQGFIRSDSTASLETEGLLGNRYVTITRGEKGQPVANKGVIPGKPGKNLQEIVNQGIALEANLGQLTEQVSDIIGAVRKGQGTVGKFIYDPSLYNHFNSTAAKLDAMVTSVREGNGSLGKFIATDDLYNKADATMGHAEAILGAVQEQKGTLGKLVYDPAVANEAKQFFSRGNDILAGVQNGQGSLGKFVKDPALYNDLRDASANVRDVTAKLNNGQGTFGKFFTDPQLYDNMTGLSGDMRLLIGDFRRNPKKFLHVKLSIF